MRLEGKPKVFHVYWNAPGEGRPLEGLYNLEEYSPKLGPLMLFNGRADLAGIVVKAITTEIERKFGTDEPLPLRLDNALDLVALAHLVLRFARELTFDVGPPFIAHVLDPANHITTVALPEWQPLTDEQFRRMYTFV